MKGSIAKKLAKKNIKANKVLFLPYMLSGIFMLSLFYVMVSLMDNPFVQTRHPNLKIIVSLGIIIVSIFITVFMIYINRFIHKKRIKEFGLYRVLGLEKKHIARIIFHEQLYIYLIVLVFSSFAGFGFGKLAFLALGRILEDLDASIMAYSFSKHAFISTTVIWTAITLIVYFIQTTSIIRYNPKELFDHGKKSETTPFLKWVFCIIGAASLGYGYYLALTAQGAIQSLMNFFVAVLFVILGTYLLFVFFMNVIFTSMQKNKTFYYKKKNFLWITGMQKRLNTNSVGLATIAILCTCVLVAVSTTTTIYQQIEYVTESSYPKEYEMSTRNGYSFEEGEQFFNEKRQELITTIENGSKDAEVTNLTTSIAVVAQAEKHGDTLEPIIYKQFNPSAQLPCFLYITTLDDYNKLYNKNETLDQNEILLSSNSSKLMQISDLKINDHVYKFREMKELPSSKYGVEMYNVVVKDFDTLAEFSTIFKMYDQNQEIYYNCPINIGADWDLKNNSNWETYTENMETYLSTLETPNAYELNSKQAVNKLIVDLDGGFLLVGYLAGSIFLAGCILITYYKQIFEGYEDRSSFEVMKKVGLPDELIRETASKQIVWMFFIPFIVAIIHTLFASVILNKMLLIFGVTSPMIFYKTLAIIALIFAVIYFIVFKLTSNVYYNIVDQKIA